MAELGLAVGPGQHPDRAARPPRRVPGRDRDHRWLAGAFRDRGAQPAAHRDRRAPGAVRPRPDRLQRHAPQAQPDPLRAHRRPGAAACAATRWPAWRTRRCGTSATSRIRRSSAWRCPARRRLLHYMLVRFRGLVDGLVVRPERMRENLERGLGLFASSRLLTALVENGRPRRARRRTASSSRAALRAADERRPLRELVEVDPDVALVLTPDQIAACFDEQVLLRHVDVGHQPDWTRWRCLPMPRS